MSPELPSLAGNLTSKDSATLMIYDGECIFCQNYVRLVRLKEAVGPVELVNARDMDPRIIEFQNRGYDLNEGMLFVWKDQVYFGSEAVNVLAMLSSDVGWFNRINRVIFTNKVVSRLFYPILRFGRRVTLILRGKKLIEQPASLL